jgi:predicted MFS family arabinose efflux permease
VSPPDAIGRAFGFVNTGYGVGSAIGPLLVGWILDQGLLQTALVVPALLFFLSMTFTLTALKIGTQSAPKELAT